MPPPAFASPALFSVGEKIYAVDNRCPHMGSTKSAKLNFVAGVDQTRHSAHRSVITETVSGCTIAREQSSPGRFDGAGILVSREPLGYLAAAGVLSDRFAIT